AGRVFLRSMNTVTSRQVPARRLAVPNLLTYARIAAVPAVVACLYWQGILPGGPWRRWVGPVLFLSAGGAGVLRGHFARQRGRAIGLRAHARPDRGQALGGVVPVDVGRRRHHPRLVAVGGDRHPLPRDSGFGPARISRRVARERAGDAARQMEDDAAARRRRV